MDPARLELVDLIVRYASPFLAAGLASLLTYLFVSRQRRMDVLTTERLGAFKSVQEALVALKHYCQAMLGELEGGDFSRRLEDLRADVARSALTQGDALQEVVDRGQIFFSRSARKELERLIADLYIIASMELAEATDPGVATPNVYSETIEQVEKCIERLYADLRLPS